MAKNCMIRREEKRKALVKKYAKVREELVKRLKDPSLSLEEKFEVQAALQKLPRDSAKSRLSNRCNKTGRAHGVSRKFGLSRHWIRKLGMEGFIPGLTKSSWG